MKKDNDQIKQIDSLTSDSDSLDRKRHVRDGFLVRQKERQMKCFYLEILWVEAARCYSDIYLKDKMYITVTHPLAMIEKNLPAEIFVRVHRSYIVNLRRVDGFIGNSVCIGTKIIPVSPQYREKLFSYFDFWDLVRRESRKK